MRRRSSNSDHTNGEYRLTVGELPSDQAERTKVRAAAIAEALSHAATDPGFRLEMIIGEAYARYLDVVDWLAGEIEKEKPAIQAYARTAGGGWSASVKEIHKALLADAVRQSILSEPAHGTRDRVEDRHESYPPSDHA